MNDSKVCKRVVEQSEHYRCHNYDLISSRIPGRVHLDLEEIECSRYCCRNVVTVHAHLDIDVKEGYTNMINIFIENERIRLYICIIVNKQHMCICPEKLCSF